MQLAWKICTTFPYMHWLAPWWHTLSITINSLQNEWGNIRLSFHLTQLKICPFQGSSVPADVVPGPYQEDWDRYCLIEHHHYQMSKVPWPTSDLLVWNPKTFQVLCNSCGVWMCQRKNWSLRGYPLEGRQVWSLQCLLTVPSSNLSPLHSQFLCLHDRPVAKQNCLFITQGELELLAK